MRSLFVVVALLAGCSSPPEADWYGDKRFTAEERVQIERGSVWLAEQAGRPAPSISWTLEIAAQAMPHTIRRERGPHADGSVAGLCKDKTVYLDPVGLPGENMKIEFLAGLAAHELAHCTLGFVDGYHPNDPPTDGIMRVLSPMRWTDAERAQCREHAELCPSGRAQ